MSNNYEKDRQDTLDRIILLVENKISLLQPSVLTIETADQAPRMDHEVWALMKSGLQHLKNGAPSGLQGSFGEAVSKTSLRSTPFAAVLGISPPQFLELYTHPQLSSGREEALYFSKRLVEAGEGDYPQSKQALMQAVQLAKGEAEDDPFSLKKQLFPVFKALINAYPRVCLSLKGELDDMLPPPPSAPRKGRSFDL